MGQMRVKPGVGNHPVEKGAALVQRDTETGERGKIEDLWQEA